MIDTQKIASYHSQLAVVAGALPHVKYRLLLTGAFVHARQSLALAAVL
jgi:hypothetical protein